MTGPVTQFQLISTDPDATARFYSEAFGWTVDRANALGYRTVATGAGGTPGGIWPAPAGATSFAQLFLAVADVDAAIARAVTLGATVLVPRSALPDGDVMAVLRDPTGLPFGLFTRRA
jgi:predicted enzyme related to lactoylglutathione lyase